MWSVISLYVKTLTPKHAEYMVVNIVPVFDPATVLCVCTKVPPRI